MVSGPAVWPVLSVLGRWVGWSVDDADAVLVGGWRVPQLKVGELPTWSLGEHPGDPHAVRIGGQLRAGVRTLAAQHVAGAYGSGGEVDHTPTARPVSGGGPQPQVQQDPKQPHLSTARTLLG